VAFFIRLQLLTSPFTPDDRILPTWYSDNYFTMFPADSKSVRITCRPPSGRVLPRVLITGWNVVQTLTQVI